MNNTLSDDSSISSECLDISSDEVREEDFIKHIASIINDSKVNIDNVPDDRVLTYAKLEMSTFPTEMTISCGMTRQRQQYSPNTYHATLKLDMTLTKKVILDAVANAPEGQRLAVYRDLKNFAYKSLFARYENHESVLRQRLEGRGKADGVALPGDCQG